MNIHPHLKQQLKDMGLSEHPPSRDDWESFLSQVSDHYRQLELDQGMYERLLSVSSAFEDSRCASILALSLCAYSARSSTGKGNLWLECQLSFSYRGMTCR